MNSNFFFNKLKKQLQKICETRQATSKKLLTVSVLFNEFLMYLFDICNNCNEHIQNGMLVELILLRYAVFSLSFFGKLTPEHDREYYRSIESDSVDRLLSQCMWIMNIDNIDTDYDVTIKETDSDESDDWFGDECDEIVEDSDLLLSGNDGSTVIITNNKCRGVSFDGKTNFTNIYQKQLDLMFEQYLIDSNHLNRNNRLFHVKKTEEIVFDEVCFVGGGSYDSRNFDSGFTLPLHV